MNQCCNDNCNQGRDCPLRKTWDNPYNRRFADLTWKHWVSAIGLALLLVSALEMINK